YMAALLTSVREHTDKVAAYVRECRRMGIRVLPPDVNESEHSFTVAGGALRFGLGAVKNVGDAAVKAILKARRAGGPFRSYWDFCRRLDPRVMNRRVLESLVKAGAFDSLGCERAALLAAAARGPEAAGRGRREGAGAQLSLWPVAEGAPEEPAAVRPLSVREKLAMEREVLGLYVSGHPLEEHADLWRRLGVAGPGAVEGLPGERKVSLGGLVAEVRRTTTRRGEAMATVTLEDQDRSLEVLFFPAVYQKYRSALRPGRAVLVRARLTGEGEERRAIAEQAWAVDRLALNEVAAALLLKASPEREEAIRRVAAQYPGPVPVYLYDGGRARARQLPGVAVDLEGAAMASLEELLGRDAVRVMWPKLACC
ncbi:MAG: DNA polymerase III subunit alpha, partial [Firmicutes bacterium]|nr:DNA polymerase III subunit alpha [Bacillota bacterium]